MNRVARPELLELDTTQLHSPSSIQREHASMSPAFSLASVPAVNPEPAYIAASAASQIVTSEYQSQHPEWEEDQANPLLNEIALVSPSSLSLINAFLDRLLFNFLASARSTSLASLRPAVTEVLKPKLAREAITGADEELQEFLGGRDDEELSDFHNGEEPPEEWDLDLVWKRTRLRCMVYTRLGDMEEDDEDMFIEQEHLEDPTRPRRLSRDIGIVSPAVAIFLTSILEFIGEHALMVAGEAAYKRCEIVYRIETRRTRTPQRVIVEETDMEKVALNPTLGRLWRSWRKLIRSPRSSISRVISRDMPGHRALRGFSSSRSTSRKSSVATVDDRPYITELDRTPSVAEVLSGAEPASIPLPLADYDVDEIEVPGYSPRILPKSTDIVGNSRGSRRFSVSAPPELDWEPQIGQPSPPRSPASIQQMNLKIDTSRSYTRPRSQSLPTPTQTPFVVTWDPEEGDTPFLSARTSVPQNTSSGSRTERDNSATSRTGDNFPNNELRNPEGALLDSSTSKQASSSPFGSVLNAISKHAARELKSPSAINTEGGAQEDYSEESTKLDRHRPKELEIGGSSKHLIASLGKAREDAQTRYSTSSSLRSHAVGEVSPLDPTFIESGEVSPIDPSENEDEHYFTRQVPSSENIPEAQNRDISPISDVGRYQDGHNHELGAVDRVAPLVVPRPTHGRQRRMDGPTEDDYHKDEKREAFVVLEDLSALNNTRGSGISSVPVKDPQADGTVSSMRSRMPVTETGMPPLTPLRDMMEAAHDTSDENSSLAPSHLERVQYPSSIGGQTSSVSSLPPSHAAKNSFNGGKGSDLRRQLPSVYTEQVGQGLDRAAVQRVSPSSGGFREPVTPQGRSSDSSNRDLRSLYAANSGTSPVSLKNKVRAKQQSGDNFSEAVPSRTSSDGSKVMADDKYNRGSSQSGDRHRSFEQLINSDQTIQYTLTPQNMREIEGPESPRTASYHVPSKTTQVVNLIRSGRTSNELQPPTARVVAPAVKGMNGLRSNPADGKHTLASEIGDVSAPSGTSFVIHSGPVLKRGPQPMARDARVEGENVRDFADFIRSTGPEQTKSLPKPPVPRPTSGSRPTTAINGARSLKASQPVNDRTVGKTPMGVNPIIAPLISENKALRKRGPRLQAREPTISRNDETSDLIDFIRKGPPADRDDSNHRNLRPVAPTRSTMDSDEVHFLNNGKSKNTKSSASTLDSSISKSLHSSVNSRTGLLDNSNQQTSKSNIQPFAEKRPAHYDEPVQPMRKQRRVRDPYAIEFDSDGDDEASHTPKPHPKEESLLDFLNSEPPPQAKPSPSPTDGSRSVQRKNSTSMRSRFTRSSSSNTAVNPSPLKPSSQVSPGNAASAHRGKPTVVQAVSSGGMRADSPHLLPQKHTKFDTYKPTTPTYAAHMDRPRGVAARPMAKPAAARPAARDDTDSMRDLADFLKNSGPPEPPAGMVAGAGRGQGRNSLPEKEESGGFSKMFSRKKRAAGVA
ncbi:hypothetical protein MMC13_003815 [Lambiella insularis]|nr:hypothetical protein [Lambiella insularis]